MQENMDLLSKRQSLMNDLKTIEEKRKNVEGVKKEIYPRTEILFKYIAGLIGLLQTIILFVAKNGVSSLTGQLILDIFAGISGLIFIFPSAMAIDQTIQNFMATCQAQKEELNQLEKQYSCVMSQINLIDKQLYEKNKVDTAKHIKEAEKTGDKDLENESIVKE